MRWVEFLTIKIILHWILSRCYWNHTKFFLPQLLFLNIGVSVSRHLWGKGIAHLHVYAHSPWAVPGFRSPMDCGLPVPSAHEIFQPTLRWGAISHCRASYRPRDWTCLSWHLLQWQEDSYVGDPKRMFGYSRRWNSTNIVFNSVDVFFILKGEVCACMLSRVWLCDPMDCNPPGSSVHAIFRAKVLQWVAISSSRGSSWPRGGTRPSAAPALRADSTLLRHQGSALLP